MNTLSAFAIVYAGGIVCLLGVGHQLYVGVGGRHRASGRQTRRRARQMADATLFSRRNREAFLALMATVPRYQHKAGVGRYAHLRIEELDATAERILRRRKRLGVGPKPDVDLQALRRIRGAAPTVADVDDEWWALMAVAT